jgi:DnaK suppressor protein
MPPPPATLQGMTISLPTGYKPSDAEDFMNPSQVEYFRQKLLRLRADTQRELDATPPAGADDSAREGDQADQASAAVDREFTVVNRERTHALLQQIERALVRLDNGTYGYCEDTGEQIALRRLDAQPTATLTTDAQAQRERSGT